MINKPLKKLTFDQKRKAEDQVEQTLINQGGQCFHCGLPFIDSNNPPQASHRIIRKYEFEYGYDIINHPLNVPVCHKDCNSAVILDPYKQSGKDHIKAIKDAILEEILNRR